MENMKNCSPKKFENSLSSSSAATTITTTATKDLAKSSGLALTIIDDDSSVDQANLKNLFASRNVQKPTSDLETFVHLIKGSLGSGILAMPLAFSNAGLLFGLVMTFTIGFICTYCVHVLVKCAHRLSFRTQRPKLTFAEVAETAFETGPAACRPHSKTVKFLINLFLVIDLIGCCCTYLVFIAETLMQLVQYYFQIRINIRLYIAALFPFLLAMNLIRKLKNLAPFSMLANALIFVGISITFYYIFQDLPRFDSVPAMAPLGQLPLFFGVVIFALEGIGVVMSLENNMKNPTHFIGCPSVLNFGMMIVIFLYTSVGFFGYLKFGEQTRDSITLNLPEDQLIYQSVKLMIAIAIFFTYSLQLYVPIEIIWSYIQDKYPNQKSSIEYLLRIFLTSFTVLMAVAIPNLGGFISLIGAVCLSTLGLIFPAVIELVTVWDQPRGLGPFKWILWKNSLLICFGIAGFVLGSFVSIGEIVEKTF